MDRTWRAVLIAAFIGFATVAGLGVFLGFGGGASLLTGAILGLLAGALILAAARRADTFHAEPPPPVEPGFPGPPEREATAPPTPPRPTASTVAAVTTRPSARRAAARGPHATRDGERRGRRANPARRSW